MYRVTPENASCHAGPSCTRTSLPFSVRVTVSRWDIVHVYTAFESYSIVCNKNMVSAERELVS